MMAGTITFSNVIWKAMPTHVNHMSLRTKKKQWVRSPPTRLKLRRNRHHCQGLLTSTSEVNWEMQNAVLGALWHGVYCTHANCKNCSTTIIISVIGKNVAKTVWGWIQFEGKIYSGEIRYVHSIPLFTRGAELWSAHSFTYAVRTMSPLPQILVCARSTHKMHVLVCARSTFKTTLFV